MPDLHAFLPRCFSDFQFDQFVKNRIVNTDKPSRWLDRRGGTYHDPKACHFTEIATAFVLATSIGPPRARSWVNEVPS